MIEPIYGDSMYRKIENIIKKKYIYPVETLLKYNLKDSKEKKRVWYRLRQLKKANKSLQKTVKKLDIEVWNLKREKNNEIKSRKRMERTLAEAFEQRDRDTERYNILKKELEQESKLKKIQQDINMKLQVEIEEQRNIKSTLVDELLNQVKLHQESKPSSNIQENIRQKYREEKVLHLVDSNMAAFKINVINFAKSDKAYNKYIKYDERYKRNRSMETLLEFEKEISNDTELADEDSCDLLDRLFYNEYMKRQFFTVIKDNEYEYLMRRQQGLKDIYKSYYELEEEPSENQIEIIKSCNEKNIEVVDMGNMNDTNNINKNNINIIKEKYKQYIISYFIHNFDYIFEVTEDIIMENEDISNDRKEELLHMLWGFDKMENMDRVDKYKHYFEPDTDSYHSENDSEDILYDTEDFTSEEEF